MYEELVKENLQAFVVACSSPREKKRKNMLKFSVVTIV